MSLSAGSSPLHSPKITPHTSPAPRRRSHTPNPANYMVPTTASDQGTHIIQKETVGGTTYFYTDNTPAPLAGMVCPAPLRFGNTLEYSVVQSNYRKMQHYIVNSKIVFRSEDFFRQQFLKTVIVFNNGLLFDFTSQITLLT